MINLTSIQILVDQTNGTLEELVADLALSTGAREGLERCIATLRSISEDINDYEETRPTVIRPTNRP